MNALLRARKDFPNLGNVPFKNFIYFVLLSNVVSLEEGDVRHAVYAGDYLDLFDCLSDWADESEGTSELDKALDELEADGYISFDDDNRIYLGEFRGRKFFPFEVRSSIFDSACDLMWREIKKYGKTRSAKVVSRVSYIRSQIETSLSRGVEKMSPKDFTELHSFMYEVYTGGETYILRNKAEHFQTTNMLKAFDKHTVFALIVFGTLNFDEYRSKGLPTITNVACMKDDVFNRLNKPEKGSKEYMRNMESDDSEF